MKEIIIDGVDVAGCIYYEPKAQVMTCHEESITKRCDKTNCYYKQLKRLEFELKVTKADYEASEQENAELKAENETINNISEHFRKEALSWAKIANEYLKDRTKFEKTLQEIKDIAEIKIDCKQYEIDHDCFNDTRCKALRELIETLQQILDLITKAESEG